MSRHTMEYLNGGNILVGNTKKNGFPWWNSPKLQPAHQIFWEEFIPIEAVKDQLFTWTAEEAPIWYPVADIEVGTKLIVVEHDGRMQLARQGQKDEEGNYIPVFLNDETRKVIYRDDTYAVMGDFKSGYERHQYVKWLLETVGIILDADLGITSAGLLDFGAVAWVQVEVPDSITTPSGVEFRPFLLAATSFNGSLASTFNRSVTVAVCDNTLAAGLSEKGQKISYKHTKNSQVKLMDAREALAVVHDLGAQFTEQVEQLIDRPVTSDQFAGFLNAYTPVPEDEGRGKTQAETKHSELTRIYRFDNRCSPWQDTVFGVIQAVNTYEHHYAITRGRNGITGDDLRAMRNTEKMVNGYFDDLDRKTLEVLEGVLAA